MDNWTNTPLIVVAVVTALTILYKFASWQGTVDADLTGIKGFMVEIREDIKKIFQKMPSSIATAQSPRKLTDYGEKLSSKLNAKEWSERIAPDVLPEVKGKQPFEIYNFCKNFVQTLSVEGHQDVFKQAYENGITDEDMKTVLALVLHHKLLKLLVIQED